MVNGPKPCPFCGTTAIGLQVCEDADGEPYMECMTCGATGPGAWSDVVWDDRPEEMARGGR